NVQDYSLPWTF
nr:immunoglobulin light chain junction region [Macaca mulatta]